MPVGVQCPISSSLGEFPSYWDWLWCPGLSPVLVSIALYPSLSVYLVFSIRSYLPLNFNRVLLYGRRIAPHSVCPSLTHFLGEFPGLGLALVPDVVVPEAEQLCAWSRKLDRNSCPGRGRTSDLVIKRPQMLPLDYRAPLQLVASYDMQEATAGPF